MSCYFIEEKPPTEGLKVEVAYIAVTNGSLIDTYAPRFVRTYHEFPAGADHKLTVICNGGPLQPHRKAYFAGVNCEFFERENDEGRDISGYLNLAHETDADFLVCFGESVYFHREGWLKKLVDARLQHGPGMYGFMASHAVRAHMNTTAFGCDVEFLRKYPSVNNIFERYEFEHGKTAMWRRIRATNKSYQARLVTWDGTWEPGQWRSPENILTRGDQSNMLCWCNHSDRFNMARPQDKKLQSELSDQRFK